MCITMALDMDVSSDVLVAAHAVYYGRLCCPQCLLLVKQQEIYLLIVTDGLRVSALLGPCVVNWVLLRPRPTRLEHLILATGLEDSE